MYIKNYKFSIILKFSVNIPVIKDGTTHIDLDPIGQPSSRQIRLINTNPLPSKKTSSTYTGFPFDTENSINIIYH